MKIAYRILACFICLLISFNSVGANAQTLLHESVLAPLAQEISGETAKRNLEYLARQHRMRGSRGFHAAAEHIVEQLRAYGLKDARIEQFPADGKIFYGTQKSRPPWDAEFAELWELREVHGQWQRSARVASWEAMPVSLAQDSESGEATADLVHIGAGTSERDYAGIDVRGKLVLTSSQPAAIVPLAIKRYGAAGIVSYAQNQRTAWYGEDENLVRWGHLDTFSETPTFAFMVSLKQARDFQARLIRGERVRLNATVRAGKHPGSYELVTATIPGVDPNLRNEEIAFSCHLDHQRPGANDNASGSVAILEVARAFSKLIREEKIAPPARTIRFIWPPEIEGTITYLNARPEIAARIKAVIHMDMVGGGPETKAIFHVTRGPNSLPSFVNDVAEHFGEFVNEESAKFAGGQPTEFPLVAPEGGKEPLLAEMAPFSLGSDHQVYADSSFGIPAIYLNDWPDRYIHTNLRHACQRRSHETETRRVYRRCECIFSGECDRRSVAADSSGRAGEQPETHRYDAYAPARLWTRRTRWFSFSSISGTNVRWSIQWKGSLKFPIACARRQALSSKRWKSRLDQLSDLPGTCNRRNCRFSAVVLLRERADDGVWLRLLRRSLPCLRECAGPGCCFIGGCAAPVATMCTRS